MLKKSVLVVALLLVATNNLWAAPPPLDVSSGRHNLSMSAPVMNPDNYYRSGNEEEVCIFCHTPHGGSTSGPLWNRNNPTASGFTHYTSASLSPYMRVTLSKTRDVSSESLLCMSCHDGTTAINSIINSSNKTGALPDFSEPMPNVFFATAIIGNPDGTAEVPSITLGKNLTDDHPISFSYELAYNDTANNGKLHLVDDARNLGIKFFGPDSATADGNRVECSSCHDPHVDYQTAPEFTPFLVMNNAGSALCLGCHIK